MNPTNYSQDIGTLTGMMESSIKNTKRYDASGAA